MLTQGLKDSNKCAAWCAVAIVALFIALFLSSCYPEKKAIKQSVKAYVYYPGSVAKLHADWFPTKDSVTTKTEYLAGDTISNTDTVTVRDTITKQTVKYITKTNTIHDTVRHTEYKSIENTAAIKAAQYDTDKAKAENVKLEKKVSSVTTQRNTWMWVAIGFIVIVLGYITYFVISLKRKAAQAAIKYGATRL